MKKTLLLIGISLLLTACGKAPAPKDSDKALITFKDKNQITVQEVYDHMKEKFALQTVVPMIDRYVLEKEFPKNIESAQEKARTTVAALKEQYGGEEEFNKVITQYGYHDLTEFEETYYLSNMQTYAIEKYAETLVKEKDIKKYYQDNIYGDVHVKHILITPKVKKDMTPDQIKKAEKAAQDKIKTIIGELKKAEKPEKKFNELVKKYSIDDDTKAKNGDLGYINYGTLSTAYDELVKAALKLKDKSFSTKIITTELGYHVIYRIDQKPKAKLEKVRKDIISAVAEKMLNENNTIPGKALYHYREKYHVKIKDETIRKQYANYVQSTLMEKDSKSKKESK